MAKRPEKTNTMDHYVPQFLLRAFADDPERDTPQVWVYDKATRRSFLASTRNVGGERGYSGFVDDDGVAVTYEPHFARIEAEAAEAIRVVEARRDLRALPAPAWHALSDFVNLQIFRSPAMASRTGAAVAAAVRDAFGVTDPAELANLRKVGEGLSRRSVLNDLDNSRRWLLGQACILVSQAETGPRWCIGDSCAAAYEPHLRHGLRHTGWSHLPILAAVPLRPRLALLVVEQAVEEQLGSADVRFRAARGRPVELGVDESMFFNELQLLESARYVFGPRDRFEWAQRLQQRLGVAAGSPAMRAVSGGALRAPPAGIPPEDGATHCVAIRTPLFDNEGAEEQIGDHPLVELPAGARVILRERAGDACFVQTVGVSRVGWVQSGALHAL